MKKVTLGGDRIGSGKQQKVTLHSYERSTHDLGYLWRSTMSSGTLVPFIDEVGLPGDTFDINLNIDVKTHPTVGPLFGSFKVQADIFTGAVRLYQGQLHNNKLGIGMNMAAVKLPQIILTATVVDDANTDDFDNAQINPSCILSYLGIRGVGMIVEDTINKQREFNGVSFLMYWDTYKNYYANKQEEIGAVIHFEAVANTETIDDIQVAAQTLPEAPATPAGIFITQQGVSINVNYTGTTPLGNQIIFNVVTYGGIQRKLTLDQLVVTRIDSAGVIGGYFNYSLWGPTTFLSWNYLAPTDAVIKAPQVVTFPLEQIDEMRELILAATTDPAPFIINDTGLAPYVWPISSETFPNTMQQTQEGLAIKTYQSDLFNNWLNTEWIDGPGGIAEVTSIDTSGGSFTIDALILARKVYNMLNRIMVSGGSYDDWQEATYDHQRFAAAETPVYQGGLIKELVFQEVVSNSQAGGQGDGGTSTQPLGTLAGKGVMGKKHKGGHVIIKVDEISHILGIISLTPRIDYSQGNKWHTHLLTMDDYHKPELDQIGFQELIQEQLAWWTTSKNDLDISWKTKSAGKQPAWINYMTNVNKTYGNFAIANNEMFMTLNRRYEWNDTDIEDLTTYIDPVKFNNIFAQTAIDAQNFWVQVAVDMTVRRKMSAKVMPNL